MTKWDNRVADHPARQQLDAARDLIRRVADDDDLPSESIENLERLDRVMSETERRLDDADAMLVTGSTLKALQQAAQQIKSELNNFAGNGNSSHVANANNQADSLLTHATHLRAAVAQTGSDVEAVGAAASSFRRSVGQLIANLEREATQAQEKLDSIQEAHKESVAKRDEKITELETAVRGHKQNMDQALSEFRESHSKAQEDRRADFADLLDSKQAEVDELLRGAKQAAESQRETTKEESSSVLSDIEDYRDQAATLVDAVGNLGTAGGYGRYAEAQRAVANRWRYTAVATVGLAVAFAIWAMTSVSAETSWQHASARLAVIALLGGLATYAGRQSGHHRRQEVDAKHLELQLAAIDPYLALLDEENRTSVKTRMADRLFGPTLGGQATSSGHDPVLSRQMTEAIQEAVRQVLGMESSQ